MTGIMEFYDFPETVGNFIIPTDELTPSFFRGVETNHQPGTIRPTDPNGPSVRTHPRRWIVYAPGSGSVEWGGCGWVFSTCKNVGELLRWAMELVNWP